MCKIILVIVLCDDTENTVICNHYKDETLVGMRWRNTTADFHHRISTTFSLRYVLGVKDKDKIGCICATALWFMPAPSWGDTQCKSEGTKMIRIHRLY